MFQKLKFTCPLLSVISGAPLEIALKCIIEVCRISHPLYTTSELLLELSSLPIYVLYVYIYHNLLIYVQYELEWSSSGFTTPHVELHTPFPLHILWQSSKRTHMSTHTAPIPAQMDRLLWVTMTGSRTPQNVLHFFHFRDKCTLISSFTKHAHINECMYAAEGDKEQRYHKPTLRSDESLFFSPYHEFQECVFGYCWRVLHTAWSHRKQEGTYVLQPIEAFHVWDLDVLSLKTPETRN